MVSSAFSSSRAARVFYKSLENGRPGGPRNRALVIINQTARALWLAARVQRVARGRPALQIMFLIFAAEAVAKLFTDYKGARDSRKHVHIFFLKICTAGQRQRLLSLGSSFPGLYGAEKIVDRLYDIRCDVVHRFQYFGLDVDSDAVRELRALVVEGAVRAARILMAQEQT
jgi:hypothetical protein